MRNTTEGEGSVTAGPGEKGSGNTGDGDTESPGEKGDDHVGTAQSAHPARRTGNPVGEAGDIASGDSGGWLIHTLPNDLPEV
jgi:hypothetical protein